MTAPTPQSRVPMLSPEAAERAAADVNLPDGLAPLSVFRILLQQPALAKAVSDLLLALLMDPTLDPRLREVIIMRIGWVTGSVYEWTQHWRIARGIGMSEEELLAVRDWRTHDAFSPAERAVLAATDESLETGVVSESTWAECVAHVGDHAALVQMVVAIGNWTLFSSLLRTLQVPLEDGMTPWPPDGSAPEHPE